MRLPRARFTTLWMILLALGAATTFDVLQASSLLSAAKADQAAPPTAMTFQGTLSEWKYPGSKMLDGATMSDGGNPLVQDVRCQAILTTPDPIEKVVKFYSEKVGAPPSVNGVKTGALAKEADAKAVATQDDSEGRPVTVRVIVVSKADTTTTLVLSRAKGEKETHIAWSHYRWFNH
jgi:hypothetical protein